MYNLTLLTLFLITLKCALNFVLFPIESLIVSYSMGKYNTLYTFQGPLVKLVMIYLYSFLLCNFSYTVLSITDMFEYNLNCIYT